MTVKPASNAPDSTILVTGGAGFIGSAVVRHIIANTAHRIVNVDKLTYAANLDNLKDVASAKNYAFEKSDITDLDAMRAIIEKYQPDQIMHLAAESHVDRSIDGPAAFIDTNIIGTYTLLTAVREYYEKSDETKRAGFRFHHISTDEVYGSLGASGLFTEQTPYAPNSPYSASKASSDMLVRAWHKTFGLPVVITNCSNNYGPYQFPEKFIPVIILCAAEGRKIPIYGEGKNIRDWLHVEDHAEALLTVLERGKIGETYNIGGWNELTNLELVGKICQIMDEIKPDTPHRPHKSLISFVTDRPGHDARYAIDARKIEAELDWRPKHNVDTGLRQTVDWYLNNDWWLSPVRARFDGARLGLDAKEKV